LQKYLLIAAGGALGSVLRYWVGTTVNERLTSRFPYGTLLVNISACLIIGVSLELLNRHVEVSPSWRFLVPIGFIGAYSTFSTFEWEIFASLRAGAFWVAILNVVVSLVLGLVAVAVGVSLAKAVR